MIKSLIAEDGTYKTPEGVRSPLSALCPSVAFYSQCLKIVYLASRKASPGLYSNERWAEDSLRILRALEQSGVRVELSGFEHVAALQGPCVFIANHMSTLETFILPGIIEPTRLHTYIVKQSLMTYPFFGHIMQDCDPVVVKRTNPREDLKAVLEGGAERLASGRSIVVFPQTTRSDTFNPAEFNTIGVKLARRAGVPIVPIALRTDAWGTGRFIKDLGRIDPKKAVHFVFGEPIYVQGRGAEENTRIVRFITEHLRQWSVPVIDKGQHEPH